MHHERAAERNVGLQMSLALLALVFILLGVKIMYIQHFGSAVPYWDQWDAEADLLYKSYVSSKLNWDILLSPHNEHRILLTRLLSIALFELNGGWDPILQMMVNAVLHVCAIVLLMVALRTIMPRSLFLPLVLFAIILFVLPIGWENFLAGFQSQFYLLVIFSILALMGFARAQAFDLRWWLSVLCTIGAFFSMASGALVAVAAFGVVFVQIVVGVRRSKKDYAALVALLLLSIALVAFVPSIPGHDGLKAHSPSALVKALLVCLDYPRKNPLIGIWVNLPLVVYSLLVFVKRPPRTSPHWIVFSLIVWWFGQILSLSYGRAVAPDSSRYLDIIIVAMPINFAILLFARTQFEMARQPIILSAIAVWLAIVVTGLVFNTQSSAFPAVLEKAAQGRQQEANVVAYLRTGDITGLQGKPFLAIPYPSPERLASLLSDPIVRLLLPQAIRPADIPQAALLDRTLLRGRFHSLVAAIQFGMVQAAPSLIGIGIALLFLAGLIGRLGRTRSVVGDDRTPL